MKMVVYIQNGEEVQIKNVWRFFGGSSWLVVLSHDNHRLGGNSLGRRIWMADEGGTRV